MVKGLGKSGRKPKISQHKRLAMGQKVPQGKKRK